MSVNQVKAGVVLNYVVIGLNALVGLLYTPYMLRMMGQNEYGLYSLAASVIAYLTIMDFGFGNAIVRYTAKFRAEGKVEEQYSMFGMFTILYCVIGLIAFVGGAVVCYNAEHLFGESMTMLEIERARVILAIMVFNLAISFPLGIYGFIVTAYERFVFQKTLNIVRILLNTAVMICLLHFGYKAVAMVVVQTVFNLLTFFINWIYCRRKIKIRVNYGSFRWGFLKEVAIYSFWIFLNAIMEQFYWSAGQFILGVMYGSVVVAVFSVAIHLKNMYYSFSVAISSVFLPKVTSMIVKQVSNEEMTQLFIRVGRIQYIVISYIIVLFVLFGRQFVKVWAGEDYGEAYFITLLFFISTAVPLIQNLAMVILQAKNRLKYRSIIIFIVSALSLVISIPITKLYGIQGLGWTIAIAVLFGHGLLLNIYYRNKIGLNVVRFWIEIAKMSIWPILSIVVFGITIKVLGVAMESLYQLILYTLGFSAVYLVVLYKFSMNKSEQQMVVAPIDKIRQILCRS